MRFVIYLVVIFLALRMALTPAFLPAPVNRCAVGCPWFTLTTPVETIAVVIESCIYLLGCFMALVMFGRYDAR